ncbi:MAG: DUF1320 domain-containing protein [Azonexus sp.]
MTYATQADLELRFGTRELAKLTDRVAGAVIDATVVTQALSDADAEVNGYLVQRYALPLSPVPSELVKVAGDIARYFLWGEKRSEAVKDGYEDALRRLREISSGRFKLVSSSPLPAAPANNGASVSEPSRPLVFNGTRY